jgi:hypothetical protein
MTHSSRLSRLAMAAAVACCSTLPTAAAEAHKWEVPLGGNAYVTEPAAAAEDRIAREGLTRWRSLDTVVSVYFRVDRASQMNLSLRLTAPEAGSTIRVRSGKIEKDLKLAAGGPQEIPAFELSTPGPGYVKIDLQGLEKTGADFANVSDLLVASATEGLDLAFVKEPGDNRFYWGRRGPSVHLGYRLPPDTVAEYFHSEITVPEGQDPIGSYFMANGFGEGYFGIQVNGPEERRVLFSVWSPFSTDNPRDIPEDQQIRVLARGEGVHTGEFGNEGSGGQSYMRFPWKAGVTYRFLTRAHPDGAGNTIYTAWFFAPENGEWKLVARFQRPKTDKHLTGLHSFLENFQDRNGHQVRTAYHGGQWARDTGGVWHELTSARFTGDDIARRGYRLDFAGGAQGQQFFMRNGGFFDEPVALGTSFEREASPGSRPDLDLEALNRLAQ